jgi:uncharacterized protein YigE (DUF2233 family)
LYFWRSEVQDRSEAAIKELAGLGSFFETPAGKCFLTHSRAGIIQLLGELD